MLHIIVQNMNNSVGFLFYCNFCLTSTILKQFQMSLAGDFQGSLSENDLRRRFEGQLNKFTNVVKGWQYRWFILDPESGRLEYYLIEVPAILFSQRD